MKVKFLRMYFSVQCRKETFVWQTYVHSYGKKKKHRKMNETWDLDHCYFLLLYLWTHFTVCLFCFLKWHNKQGFSASKCDVGNGTFSNFWKFWGNFGVILWNSLGAFFEIVWEFFGNSLRNSLGILCGILWEFFVEFFGKLFQYWRN